LKFKGVVKRMNSTKSAVASIDVSTRAKRRKAMSLVVEILESIRTAEEAYMERMPVNFHSGGAYAAADDSVDAIIDAVIGLSDAY